MNSIKSCIEALDDEIIRKKKEYLSLAQAHRVLTSRDLMTIADVADGKFKELLETNKIKSAYQTKTTPKQWRIRISDDSKLRNSREEIENFEEDIDSPTQSDNSNVSAISNLKMPEISRIGWVAIILIVLLIGYFIDSKNSVKIDQPIVWNGADGSVYQVVNYLKQEYLRDPDSYQSIEWSDLTKGSEKYMVRHKFRAKNGFGGYEEENKIFYLDLEGKVIYVMDY